MNNSQLYEHYIFWEWQYCYRNSLLRSFVNKNPGHPDADKIASGVDSCKYFVVRFGHRLVDKSPDKALFDSKKILKNTLRGVLEYKVPETQRIYYHSLVYDILDREIVDELHQNKGGLIPFDFSAGIEVAKLELDLFYHQYIQDMPSDIIERRKYDRLVEEKLNNLMAFKIKKSTELSSFDKNKQDPPRAIGLFLWDQYYKKNFERGSKSNAYKEIRSFIEENNLSTNFEYFDNDFLKNT
jgi:hypothetical protein